MRAAILFLFLGGSAALAGTPDPISSAWKEQPIPHEEDVFRMIPAMVREAQRYNTRFFGEELKRVFHPFPLVGLQAEFQVAEDLPEAARHGVFVPGAKYKSFVRFSRGLGIWTSDKVPDIWGMAVKLTGVPGKALLKDPVFGRVQDFTALNSVNFPAPNALAIPKILRTASDYSKFAWRGPRSIRLRDYPMGIKIFGRLLARRIRSLASENFWSGAPIKLGPHAVKFQFHPTVDRPEDRPEGKRWLRADLVDRVKQGPVVFDFRVQFYRNESDTPIEENMVEWKPKDAPWVTIARLVIPRQKLAGEGFRRQTEAIDKYFFHPWQVIAAHRPLGSVMRARRWAYSASQMNRGRPTPDPLVVEGERLLRQIPVTPLGLLGPRSPGPFARGRH